MRIAYLEDNKEDREYAIPLVKGVFAKKNISVKKLDIFERPEDFLARYKRNTYDVVILDIYMPGMSGMEVAKFIRKTDDQIKIIFCSSSNEFAVQSYDLHASYYIQKPITEETVSKMIDHMRVEDNVRNARVTLPDGQRFAVRNVIVARYNNHRIDITFKNGMSIYTWLPFHKLVDILGDYTHFCRIHSGTLINLHEVTKLENSVFTMSDGLDYMVSRRRRSEVVSYYREWILHGATD